MQYREWTWGQPLTPEEEEAAYELLESSVTLDPDDGWEGEKLTRSRDRVQGFIRRHHRLPNRDETTESEADAILEALDLL